MREKGDRKHLLVCFALIERYKIFPPLISALEIICRWDTNLVDSTPSSGVVGSVCENRNHLSFLFS